MARHYTADQVDEMAAVIGARIKTASGLPVPDNYAATDNYFYFGWSSINGDWLIQRQDREASAALSATTGAADYNAAWEGLESLEYI